MNTLQEIIHAITKLSAEERDQLRVLLNEHPMTEKPSLSAEERAARLEKAFAELRAGLSEQTQADITAAMTEDYIEDWDETAWQD